MTNVAPESAVLYLRLVKTRGIGAKTVKFLVDRLGTPSAWKEEELLKLGKKGKLALKALRTPHPAEEKLLKLLRQEELHLILYGEKNYPSLLAQVPDPPPLLFYGGVPPFEGIGVVGTRRPSALSLRATEKLVEEKGKPVVSGGAVGIDQKAHESAVKAGLPTVVVLGSGLLRAEGRLLKLAERGEVSLVSEFLPWEPATRYTFPRRNRLIAGLSEELFVMEAGEKSGALITARYALSYRRPVKVFVGEGERWEGCKKLLEEGKAERWEPSPDGDLPKLLKEPRTFDELLALSGMGEKELLLELSRLMAQGKVKREGAYYWGV